MSFDVNRYFEELARIASGEGFDFHQVGDLGQKTVRRMLCHSVFPRPFERFGVRGNDLVGAEIGVFKGKHALSLLTTLDISTLYLIDPYEPYEGYEEGKLHGKEEDLAREALRDHSDRIVWVKKMSSEALGSLPDGMDFVYIDGNHSYEFVRADMDLYYPKLRHGGTLGGHDIGNAIRKSKHDGVVRAVTEFAVEKGLRLHVDLPDWWVVKGRGWER